MTLVQFANLVSEMRHWQKEYFRTRNQFTLEEAMKLERKVDTVLTQVLSQPTLFDMED